MVCRYCLQPRVKAGMIFYLQVPYTIPGLSNFLLANTIPRLLPRKIVALIMEKITRPQIRSHESALT
jgi:hypothetical protein